jgi:hypothetical protein
MWGYGALPVSGKGFGRIWDGYYLVISGTAAQPCQYQNPNERFDHCLSQ